MFHEESSGKDFSLMFEDQSRRSCKSPRFRLSNLSPEIQNVFECDQGAPTNFCKHNVSEFKADRSSADLFDDLQISSKREITADTRPTLNHKIKKTSAKTHQPSKDLPKGHRPRNKRNRKMDDLNQDSTTHFTFNSQNMDDTRSLITAFAEQPTHPGEKELIQIDCRHVMSPSNLTIPLGCDGDSTINFTIKHEIDIGDWSKKKRSVSFVVRPLNSNMLSSK